MASDDLLRAENQIVAHADARFEEPCCWCCLRFFARSRPRACIPDVIVKAQKILVLDLDETLIHCSFHPPAEYDFMVSVPVETQVFDAYIQKRPFVDEFIAKVINSFYVVIFTASLQQYANPIIDQICPSLPQEQRMFRENCTFKDGFYVKDLSIFSAPLENIVIVDNNPASFLMHPDNAILSETWEGDPTDTELMDYILPVLTACISADDVKPILAEHRKPR
jgi:Dullard-like phosphatase family protein